jgi:hypothetical protein
VKKKFQSPQRIKKEIRKNNKRNVSTNMPLQQLPNSVLNYLLLNENSFKPNCKFPCVVYVGSYL